MHFYVILCIWMHREAGGRVIGVWSWCETVQKYAYVMWCTTNFWWAGFSVRTSILHTYIVVISMLKLMTTFSDLCLYFTEDTEINVSVSPIPNHLRGVRIQDSRDGCVAIGALDLTLWVIVLIGPMLFETNWSREDWSIWNWPVCSNSIIFYTRKI